MKEKQELRRLMDNRGIGLPLNSPLQIINWFAIKINETKAMLVQEKPSWYDKNGELTFAD